MKKITIITGLIFTAFLNVNSQNQADFSGITDGEQVCKGAENITISSLYNSNGTFSGNGITDNGDGSATLNTGNINTSTDSITYQVSTPLNFIKLSIGSYHTVGIRADSTLWGWGRNAEGQLGDSASISLAYYIPTLIDSNKVWKEVGTGYNYTLAIRNDGTLWASGENYEGCLGDGTTQFKYKFIQIGTDTDWKKIEGGLYRSAAIKNDGTLWTWGSNNYGGLGNGLNTNADVLIPTQIGTDTDWADISNGDYFSLALKIDGTLWSWGYNGKGQLGDGTNSTVYSPNQIGTDSDWKSINASQRYFSLSIKENGTLWAWGDNTYGQLGDGTYVDKNVPTLIGSDTNWVAINAGRHHALGIKKDSSLWAWGYNNRSQLGTGVSNPPSSNIPLQIGNGNNWKNVFCGVEHSSVISSEDSLYSFGRNYYASTGVGNAQFITNIPLELSIDTSKTINYNIIEPSAISTEVTTCGNYTWIDNITYDSSTVATYIISNGSANGCDSIINLNLTIYNTLDNSVSFGSNSIISNQDNATYQWINCDDNSVLLGETNQEFTPNSSGNYAVIISVGSCSDTSNCSSISVINSLEDKNINSLKLYPNPTTSVINFNSIVENATLLNIEGKQLNTYSNCNSIDLSSYDAGLYFIKTSNGLVYKVIKKDK